MRYSIFGVCLCVLVVSGALAIAVDDSGDERRLRQVQGALQQAYDTRITDWEIAAGTRGGPWRARPLPTEVPAGTFRMRAVVRIPEVYAGMRVKPGPAYLALTAAGPADHAMQVLVNDHRRDALPVVDPQTRMQTWPRILLDETAGPGDSYTIILVIRNPGIYPPHEYLDVSKQVSLTAARLDLDRYLPARERLLDMIVNLHAADQLTQPWKPRDGRRRWLEHSATNLDAGTLSGLRAHLTAGSGLIDLEALNAGDFDRLEASWGAALSEMEPIGRLAKRFTVHAVANAHIDVAWLWRMRETVQVAVNTFRSVLNNMVDFPEMTYAQSQAVLYDWVSRHEPELMERIQAARTDGSWEPVGGSWVEMDCNMPGGEAMVRQFLAGQLLYTELFGRPATIAWHPDSFGFGNTFPQFLAGAGIRGFMTTKMNWNRDTAFPYPLFWWEGPGGERVLACLPQGSYEGELAFQEMIDALLAFEHGTGLRESLQLYGVGNHGGGPNREMLERIERLNRQPLFPRIIHSSAEGYFDYLFATIPNDLPVWRDELYLENHRATLTTNRKMKMLNRRAEAALDAAERLASLAWIEVGQPYPSEELDAAWKELLTNQFHDILPGTSIPAVSDDAVIAFQRAISTAQRTAHASIHALIPVEQQADSGAWLAVFNSMTWPRQQLARIEVESAAWEIRDASGVAIPSIIVEDAQGRLFLEFRADLPAMGYAAYEMRPADTGAITKAQILPASGTHVMENDRFRLKLDLSSGSLISLFDKRLERECIEEGSGALTCTIHENLPKEWSAWNIDYTGRVWEVDTINRITYLDQRPLRQIVRIEASHLGPSKMNRAPTEGFPSSFFTTEIILNEGSGSLEVNVTADWREDNALLKLNLPLNLQAESARYETAYGWVERPTQRENAREQARFEYGMQRWMDLSEQGFGISVINDGTYGVDTEGSTVRLTLLNAPVWPDPGVDRGIHTMRFWIRPHDGEALHGTVRAAMARNNPLLVQKLGGEPVAKKQSFLRFDHPGSELVAMKKTREGDSILLRVWRFGGGSSPVPVRLPWTLQQVHAVDLLERPLDDNPEVENRHELILTEKQVQSYILTTEGR